MNAGEVSRCDVECVDATPGENVLREKLKPARGRRRALQEAQRGRCCKGRTLERRRGPGVLQWGCTDAELDLLSGHWPGKG
jgi:hypothetical protein